MEEGIPDLKNKDREAIFQAFADYYGDVSTDSNEGFVDNIRRQYLICISDDESTEESITTPNNNSEVQINCILNFMMRKDMMQTMRIICCCWMTLTHRTLWRTIQHQIFYACHIWRI